MYDELKSYPATARRRQQLREAGDVALSHALTSAIVLTTTLLAVAACSGYALSRLAALMRLAMAHAVPGAGLTQVSGEAMGALLGIAGPVALAALLTCVAARGVQTGFLWASRRATPRLPVIATGALRQAVGTRGLAVGVQAAMVAAGAGLVLYHALGRLLPDAASFAAAGPGDIALVVARVTRDALVTLCLLLLLVGTLDALYHRWERERRIRMSRREVLRELRESGGPSRRIAAMRGRRIGTMRSRRIAAMRGRRLQATRSRCASASSHAGAAAPRSHSIREGPNGRRRGPNGG